MRVLVLVLGSLLGFAHVTFAQTAADLFAQGLQLIEAGKPAEACAKLEQALRLEPDKPGVLLNLGVCNEKQNKVATALMWFRKAMTLAAERGIKETENVAREQIKSLSPRVPTIKIVLTGADDGAVTLDGARVPPTSFARLEADAGPHKLEAHAPGKEPLSQDVIVDDKPDARQAVTLALVPEVAHAHAKDIAVPRYVEIDRGASRRHIGFIVGATGGGLVLAAGGLSLLAKNRFDASDDVSTRRSWKTVAHWGATSMFAGGIAALAVGIGLYVSAPDKERVLQATLVPVVDGSSAGFAVGGAF
jgi:hypothetical protein